MGYRIVYGRKKGGLSKRTITFIISVLVCLLIVLFGYFTRPKLPEAALENMADAVQNGESLSEAITAFCQEVIGDAQICS
jgi:hypothetical protein